MLEEMKVTLDIWRLVTTVMRSGKTERRTVDLTEV